MLKYNATWNITQTFTMLEKKTEKGEGNSCCIKILISINKNSFTYHNPFMDDLINVCFFIVLQR